MRLMRRVRDGKVAVYEQSCIATGRWEEVVAKEPEAQKPPRPPRQPKPLKPLVRSTTTAQVAALFTLPKQIDETQKQCA